jgi:hypothetical protein
MEKGDTCVGVEILNEPGYPNGGILRQYLLDYYREVIKVARDVGLSANKPIVIFE